ncbi:hypothetical protein LRLP16767_LR202_01373 [Limosilactobacillus reuteri]|uniref:Uncharacterized protein n=1 Tax=Limosilactobacillus reuteri TaxID=1598 RepID=A0A0U5JZH8_LIMRT|nr:hypothetical protein LRLP16767_LR202_01373 [Limosilactobacillus reuteri]
MQYRGYRRLVTQDIVDAKKATFNSIPGQNQGCNTQKFI